MRDQHRVGRVDQHRVVAHVRVAGRGGVEFLFEHALVHRGHRPLGSAADGRPHANGLEERNLGHLAAHSAADVFGAPSGLVVTLALAVFFGAVGIIDRHADDRDRRVDPADGPDAREPAPGADDDLAINLLAQNRVGAADVTRRLGRDRRGLQAETVLAHGPGRFVDDLVVSRPTMLERQVVPFKRQVDADHRGIQHAQGLLEEFLPGLVALHDHECFPHHHSLSQQYGPRRQLLVTCFASFAIWSAHEKFDVVAAACANLDGGTHCPRRTGRGVQMRISSVRSSARRTVRPADPAAAIRALSVLGSRGAVKKARTS